MSKQSQAFFKGEKMTTAEIKQYFKEKVGTRRGSFDLETERLLKEVEKFEQDWWDRTIDRFMDGKAGRKFIEDHEDKNPDQLLEILMKESNLGKLFNAALRKKISELRGVIA